jgi:hypothetical protein
VVDLFIVEDVHEGRSCGKHRRSVVRDGTVEAVLRLDVDGLGLATGDVNHDGWTDLSSVGQTGCSSAAVPGFEEVASDVFKRETYDDDLVAGAVFDNVNGERLLGSRHRAPLPHHGGLR